MKKFICFILFAILCISFLFGCGKDPDIEANQIAEDYLRDFYINIQIDEQGNNIGVSTPVVIGLNLPTVYFKITDSNVFMYDSNTEDEIQSLKFDPVDDLELSQANFKAVDINFDGCLDIQMLSSQGTKNVYYYCWLWNINKNQYVFNEDLSDISDLFVNTEEKNLSGYYSDSAAEHSSTTYVWENGKPVISREERQILKEDGTLVLQIYERNNKSELELISETPVEN